METQLPLIARVLLRSPPPPIPSPGSSGFSLWNNKDEYQVLTKGQGLFLLKFSQQPVDKCGYRYCPPFQRGKLSLKGQSGQMGWYSCHPGHSDALVDLPIGPHRPQRTLGRTGCNIPLWYHQNRGCWPGFCGWGGEPATFSPGRSSGAGAVPKAQPEKSRKLSILFVCTSLSSERTEGDLPGYRKTDKCEGRKWRRARCLHET